MKRKAESQTHNDRAPKRQAKPSISPEEAHKRFRTGLFDKKVLINYTSQYASSSPYKHCVIHDLINDRLLRDVKSEIDTNIVFTLKETDIYRIHQSGDLANIDGLDAKSRAKLPSLLKLRDALYSQSFRDYVSSITGSGPLSGQKRDLAINTYRPGGYLICHDDVIGTRKVSYILYLVDPDTPWKPEWGGALRLFPVRQLEGKDGEPVARAPGPDHCVSIPPAWNQLSFFAVQPNESFHDVEEVYHAATKEQLEKDGGRVRMAISGWFHIPQVGEDGYVANAAEELEKNSGLAQLQGNPDQYDMPQPNVVQLNSDPKDDFGFEETELNFLLKYIHPQWLVPDYVERMLGQFQEESFLVLDNFLAPTFAAKLRTYVEAQEATPLPESSDEIEKGDWKVAKPPHKHRYLYLQTVKDEAPAVEESPLTELMDELLPSLAFLKWINAVTGTKATSLDVLARRFRRGKDYTLATGYEGAPRLEVNVGVTTAGGWKDGALDDQEDEEDEEEDDEEEEATAKLKSMKKEEKPHAKKNGKTTLKDARQKLESQLAAAAVAEQEEQEDVGGHEIYMATDTDGADAAVYKAAPTSEDDDGGVLFGQAPAFSRLTLVLRDGGILKFVKYVSRKAEGDRWDVAATYEVEVEEPSEDEDEKDEGEEGDGDEEEEFEGFSD